MPSNRAFRRLPCFLARSLHGSLAEFFGLGAPLAFGTDFLQFIVGEMLDSNEGVVCRADSDQLIEFDLNRGAVPVLRVLDQKNHQKRDNGRARVDHKLPRIGILKQRPRDSPYNHDKGRQHESQRATGGLGCSISDITEEFAEVSSTRGLKACLFRHLKNLVAERLLWLNASSAAGAQEHWCQLPIGCPVPSLAGSAVADLLPGYRHHSSIEGHTLDGASDSGAERS